MNENDSQQKIALSAIALSLFLALTSGASDTAKAEDNQVHGLKIVTLEGVYKYNSGGVPLFGYVQERLPDDNVSFLVCRTAKTIQVSMKLLQPVPEPCVKSSTPTPAPWIAWYFADGQLVPSAKGQKTVHFDYGNISVGDLPHRYQGMVAASKEGELAAYSFTDYKGGMSLGVISKPQL